MRIVSRRGRTAGDVELSTSPGKGGVLSVIFAADVIEPQAERMNMALGRTGQRKAIGRRVAGMVEVKRLGRVWINPHGSFGGHVHQAFRLHRPLRSAPIK